MPRPSQRAFRQSRAKYWAIIAGMGNGKANAASVETITMEFHPYAGPQFDRAPQRTHRRHGAHHRQSDVIRCQAHIPEYVCADVRCRHAIERLPQSHGGLALVHAITIDPETGKLAGAADTGSGGMALEV